MSHSDTFSSGGRRMLLSAVIIIGSCLSVAQGITTSSSTAVWVYSWPYGESNSCKCEERINNGTRYLEFETAEDCLESFSLEDTEYCSYEKAGETGGITLKKCSSATSIIPGINNTDCQTLCVGVVTGINTVEDFFETCSLELIAHLDQHTSVPVGGVPGSTSSCFTNFVYGWTDYDPSNTVQAAPIGVFHDADTPSDCQELCQLTKGCVHFTFRANCDSQGAGNGFQNPVGTCLLYDKEYMEGVLSVDLALTDMQGSAKYCDVNSYQAACGADDPASATTFNPFDTVFDRCLLCGCVSKCSWKTTTHISGPKYCGDDSVNVCKFPDSNDYTTRPPPECPTEACPTEGEHCPDECYSSSEATGQYASSTTSVDLQSTTAVELDSTTPSPTQTTTGIELDTTTAAAVCSEESCPELYGECDDDDC